MSNIKSIRIRFNFRGLILLVCIAGLFNASTAFGREFVRESIRARGMGNAHTAVVNDEFALFYNPAGLKSVPRMMFEVLTLGAGVNETVMNIGEFDSDNLGDYAGDKFYTEFGGSALSITAPGWGYSIFFNGLLDLGFHNPTIPYLDVTAYFQAGMMGGMAFRLMDDHLDVGVAVKAVNRSGIAQDLHMVEFAPLIDGDVDVLDEKFSTVTAYAPDIGATYHFDRFPQFPMKISAVLQNIGGLNFENAGEVPMQLNGGLSSEIDLGLSQVLLAADMVDILGAQEDKSTREDIKLGTEIGFLRLYNGHHLAAARLGFNGSFISYGLSLNVYGIKFDFAQWSEDITENSGGMSEDKRQSFKLSFIF